MGLGDTDERQTERRKVRKQAASEIGSFVKDTDQLKNNQVVTEEVITGDYQPLAGGLQIRFGGSTDASVPTASNEWEVEVAGWQEEVDNSAINSVRMTRR